MLLCDTNVLSELARPAPHPAVLAWAEGVSEVALSVVTLEELEFVLGGPTGRAGPPPEFGLAWRDNARVRRWLDAFIAHSCRILPVTDAVARQSGVLRGRLRAAGKVRTQADMLIAATAALHGLTLVTRNAKDFGGCGIDLHDPFAV